MNLAAILFIFVFGACTDEHFIPEDKSENPPVVLPGDTIASFSDFALNHSDWSYSNGLAASEPFFDGYVEYKVDGQVVKSDLIDHENAPMSISWEPIAETKGSGEKMYQGFKAEKAEPKDTLTNQKVNFIKYERECKLSFVGLELTLTGSWYEASLSSNSKIVACRYDSTTVATQKGDTVKVDGEKIEVELDGKKYNRVVITAKALNHFTDLPAGTTHKEQMDIEYSVLVPVIFVPGEKFYEGSIAGNGSYVKASEESYRSELNLTHIFTQDGQQIKEQETVSGTASVRTWVEEAGNKMIVPTIAIGNPTVSVSESTSDLYQKEGYIYAKKYTTTWSYTWSNGFTKKVYSEVERLYYRREAGKEVAMPFGETSTSFSNFNAGNSVEKSENGKKYEAYPNGMVYFSGAHKSETGNVNDAISGLSVGQEFWVEKEVKDEFLGFDKEIVPGNNNNASKIIITEHWSVSGDKTLTFTQSANYSFTVSEQQRVFGESLSFISGLSKSTDNPKFNEVKEGQFARTITSTYVAKFNLCEVKAIAKATEAYVEYRGEKINFEFAETSVEYKGINNPTATEVDVNGTLFSRKAYEVSFAHSVLGTKSASVLVDQEIDMDPTAPDEWGKLDIEKTKNFGGLSWSWKNVNGKLIPFVSGTIVTEYGVVSFWEGGNNFTKMNTNTITDRLSNSIKSEGPEYLIPAYIRILTDPNKHWGYQDVNGQYRDEINGVDIEMLKDVSIDKPFIAEGGEANVYEISNGRVIVTYQGKVLFNEVFAK